MNKILKILKNNKLSIFIIFLFLMIIYIVISNFRSDKINNTIAGIDIKDPYILLLKWNAIIKRDKIINLKEKDKKDLKVNDKITTFENSNATIFWPDWSITRLWSKSAITITEMNIKKNLSEIKIKFNLEQWKTWSNITKFFSNDSYFTETYDFWNYAATVRGTVFEINLDENYIHAINHDVDLLDIKKDEIYNVQEWLWLNIWNPKNRIPNEIFDQERINENLLLDNEYIKMQIEELSNKINWALNKHDFWTKLITWIKLKFGNQEYIASNLISSIFSWKEDVIPNIKRILPTLSSEDKANLNERINTVYQNIHSLPNSDKISLYKMELRDIIIKSSPDDIKEKLKEDFLRLNIYDYLELSKDKTSKTAEILKANIEEYLKQMQDPEKLKELLSSFWENMLNVIDITFSQINSNINTITKDIISNLPKE